MHSLSLQLLKEQIQVLGTQFEKKKSCPLPFPTDFFYGYNEKCGFSTVTQKIAGSTSLLQ